MRAHIAHHEIPVLFDLSPGRRDLAPGIIHVFEKIPVLQESGALGENVSGMRKRRGLDFSLPQREQAFGVGSNLEKREVLVWIQAALFCEMTHEKIGKRAKT